VPQGHSKLPLGDPNCGLFPQGPIIPVPPSTPLYRPVGAYGNNWVVSPDRHAKRKPLNQRIRRPLFPLFRWRLCPEATPKQYQAVLGSTQNASPEASTRYSHSFTLVCCGAIPIGSSSVVGFVHLAAESLRVSSLRRLGQALGQICKLFRNREPAVSFLSRGQKRGGFEALKRPRWMIKRLIFLFGARLAK